MNRGIPPLQNLGDQDGIPQFEDIEYDKVEPEEYSDVVLPEKRDIPVTSSKGYTNQEHLVRLDFKIFKEEDEYIVEVGNYHGNRHEVNPEDLLKYDQVTVACDETVMLSEFENPFELASLVTKFAKGNVEIMAFKGFNFTKLIDVFTCVVQKAVKSRLLKLIFQDCDIPKIDKNFTLSMVKNKTKKQRPLYCLSMVKCSFKSDNKVKDISAICKQLCIIQDQDFNFDDGLAMIDLSQNSFDNKEITKI